MAVLNVQNISKTGLAVSYGAAAGGGDSFKDNGRQETFLEVVNDSGAEVDVTVAAQHTTADAPGVGTIAVPDIVVAVPAAGRRMIGPFPAAYRADDGSVEISYESVTSVTVAAIRLARAD